MVDGIPPPSRVVSRRLWTLGRDLGPLGRLIRFGSGLVGIGLGAWWAVDEGFSGGDAAAVGLFVVLIALAYLAVMAVAGRRLLERIGPWAAAAMFLTPLVALATLPGLPLTLRVAVALYFGISLIVTAAIRYGGCEVVSIPMLALGRRDIVYCPLNAVDAVERPLTQIPHRPTTLIATALAVTAAILYLAERLVRGTDTSLPFNGRWSAVLLIPAIAVLARHAWRARGDDASPQRTSVRLGALTLAAAALIVAVTGSMTEFFNAVLWVILPGGAVAAVWRFAHRQRTIRKVDDLPPDNA